MKKLLLLLAPCVIAGSLLFATDTNNLTVTGRVITQRMDVSTMGKVTSIGFVDGSSQTTAGFVRFKDEGTYFMSGSTIDCVGAGITCSDAGNGVTQIQVTATGGGGGGGGGGGAIYDGATTTAMSTFTVAGAKFLYSSGITTITVLFNGVLASSHTGPNFWSSTQAGAAFFSVSLTTTATRIFELGLATSAIMNIVSTNSVQLANVSVATGNLMAIISTTGIQVLNLSNSTGTLSTMISTTGIRLSEVQLSTNAYASFANIRASTSDARIGTIGSYGFWVSSGNNQFPVFVSTVIFNGTALSTSAFDAIQKIATFTFTAGSGSGSSPSFQNPSTGTLSMGLTQATAFGIANSTGIEIGRNLQLTTWMSTVAAALGGSGQTQDQVNALITNSTPTLLTMISTTGIRLSEVQLSTNAYATFANLRASTSDARVDAFANFRSTTDTKLDGAYTAINSTWSNLGSSTQAILTSLYSYESTADVRMGNIQTKPQFSFDGSVMAAVSTTTILTPFGNATVANTAVSSYTVEGATNPYRSVSIPAAAWYGCGQSSASKINGGFAMTSTATAYDNFGEMFHLFDVPNSTKSFVCTSFRMPYEWDGSSVAFQTVWHSTGLSGTSVDKLMGWSFGAVAFSSGSSIYQAVTSSVTVFSAFSSTNTDLNTPQSASYSILGGPLPGERVKLVLNAGGGGFTGLPRMTETLMLYHQKFFDGIPR